MVERATVPICPAGTACHRGRFEVCRALVAVEPARVAGYASDLVSGLGPAVESAAIDILIQALRDPRPI
jgi:hypothetical protein